MVVDCGASTVVRVLLGNNDFFSFSILMARLGHNYFSRRPENFF